MWSGFKGQAAVLHEIGYCIRELHGDGDDGTTAVTAVLPVMGLNFMINTTVIEGMRTAFTLVPREGHL